MRLPKMLSRPREPRSYEIFDLPERHQQSYFRCLEDWSSDMVEAGEHKAAWFVQAQDWGLRVKLAVDDEDQPVGMIQYLPIEHGLALGHDLFFILCIWVHGYPKGVGDAQRVGIGSALLEAAEADAAGLGAQGMAAWGMSIPVWMKASWFKKHGYERADRAGARELVWKPFQPDAKAPQWIPEQPVPDGAAGEVTVTAYRAGWCPAASLVYERSKRAAEDIGTPVHFRDVEVLDRPQAIEHGHCGEVFIDGAPVQRGAPPSYQAIKKRIERKARKLRRRSG